MATLSGQTIQSTYKGLLKLADSSNGITSSYQQIQDGLGNDTGILLKNDYIFDNAHITKTNFKPLSLGSGWVNGLTVLNTFQNVLGALAFYDNGQYSYSSITLNVRSATTTSDVVTFAFYDIQMTSRGIMPRNLLMSGITIPVNSTGIITVTLPSALSFSASPGLNYLMFKVSNSGVNPTARFMQAITAFPTVLQQSYGFTKSTNNDSFTLPTNPLAGSVLFLRFTGLSNFQTSFTEAELISAQGSSGGSPIGFLLNTI